MSDRRDTPAPTDDALEDVLRAAFVVPAPDAMAARAGADAVERRLEASLDERAALLESAFAVAEPDALQSQVAAARVERALVQDVSRVPRASQVRRRAALFMAFALLVGVTGAVALWLAPERPRVPPTPSSVARTQLEVRLVEGPLSLIGVQRVSQRAAERLVLQVGGGGQRAARLGTSRDAAAPPSQGE